MFLLRQGWSLAVSGIIAGTDNTSQVIGDMWEDYLKLLDDNIPDGYVISHSLNRCLG